MADTDISVGLNPREFNRGIRSIQRTLGGIKGQIASAFAVGEIVSLGNQMQTIQNRLRGVSSSAAQTQQAFKLISQVARDTRSGLGDVADLFANLTVATGDMGKTQDEVAAIAQTFSKSLKISGADAGAAAGAIRQFGQALGSGVLRGDEFNSIMEANPVFMREVASTLGVTIAEMRDLAAAGALTSDVIVAATEEISGSIDDRFGSTVATLGERWTLLQNRIIELFTNVEEKYGIFDTLGDTIQFVTDNLSTLAEIMKFLVGAVILRNLVSMVSGFYAMARAVTAAAVASRLLGKTPVGLLITAGATLAISQLDSLSEGFDKLAAKVRELTSLDMSAFAPDIAEIGDVPSAEPKSRNSQGTGRAAELLRGQAAAAAEAARLTEKARRETTELSNVIRDMMTDLDGWIDTVADPNGVDAFMDEMSAMAVSIQGVQDVAAEMNSSWDILEEMGIHSFEPIRDAGIDAMTELKLATDGFIRDFSSTLVDGLLDGEMKFRDFADNVLRTLAKMALNDLFTSLFTGGGPLSFGSLFGGARANGGPVASGKAYLVGERGPELFSPGQNGHITSNEDLMAGGGTSVTYNINAVDARSFVDMLAQHPQTIHALTMQGAKSLPM